MCWPEGSVVTTSTKVSCFDFNIPFKTKTQIKKEKGKLTKQKVETILGTKTKTLYRNAAAKQAKL